MQEDQDQLRSENNSQRKKIISLQIDYEKLSRRPSQVHSASSGGGNDEPFHLATESPSISHLMINELNNSVQSDIATSQLRQTNKLEFEAHSCQQLQVANQTIDLDDVGEKPFEVTQDKISEDVEVLDQEVKEETKEECNLPVYMTKSQHTEPEVQFSISAATLALLAEENAQLKDDIDRKMKTIKEYKYLVDEFNDKLQAEVEKSEQLKLMLKNIQNTKSWGWGGRNQQT